MPKIVASIDRPPADLIERFRKVRSEVVYEMIDELIGEPLMMHPAIRPLQGREWKIVGPAVTVLPDGTDTFTGIAALGVIKPGDIVVVAARGDCSNGVWGGGLSRSAAVLGAQGAVVDGAALDGPDILAGDFPVFCRTSMLPHKIGHRPGSVNIPVLCGGVPVNPGDLVMGDVDGVLIIPREQLETIIGPAEEKTARITAFGDAMASSGQTLFDLRAGRERLEAMGVTWVD